VKKRKIGILLVLMSCLLLFGCGKKEEVEEKINWVVVETGEYEDEYRYHVISNGISCYAEIVEYIGTNTQVIIPEKINDWDVISIGDSAFLGKREIKKVAIPDTVKTIEQAAFYGCTSLKEIIISKSITEIGKGAFYQTPWLEDAKQQNPMVIVNDILLDGTQLTGNVEIPSGIRKIASTAFCGAKIQSVEIADGVVEIGKSAFEACEELAMVKVPKSVCRIGARAFEGTVWLDEMKRTEEFVIVNYILIAVNGVGEDVILPEGIEAIAGEVFYMNQDIQSVSAPSSLKRIGEAAFADCRNLKKVTLQEGVEEIEQMAFSGLLIDTEVSVPASVTYIGRDALCGCGRLGTLIVVSGSYAEQYAKENDLNYEVK